MEVKKLYPEQKKYTPNKHKTNPHIFILEIGLVCL